MRETVDDGIVNGRCFGHDDGDLGDHGRDERGVTEDPDQRYNGERGPRKNPQGDIDDSDFRSSDFCRNGVLFGITAQRADAHLLGLETQLALVPVNGPHDAGVAADDDQDRYEKLTDAGGQDVGSVHHIPGVRVERTPAMQHWIFNRFKDGIVQVIHSRSQHAVHRVIPPADQRTDGPSQGPDPRDQDQDRGFAVGQRLAAEPVDDDVVTIPRDEHQAVDLAVSKQGSCRPSCH